MLQTIGLGFVILIMKNASMVFDNSVPINKSVYKRMLAIAKYIRRNPT